jgi:hypothetical protein
MTVTQAVAVAEGRLLARSRTAVTGAVLCAALGYAWGFTTMPTWASVTANGGMAALVLGGVLMLLGHLAASRDHRYGSTETSGTFPAPVAARTTALLAVVPVAAVLAAVVFGAQLVAQVPAWPAGPFDPWTLVPPLVVPVLGALLGVVVGGWLPATAAGPLAVTATAAGVLTLPLVGDGYLFPVVLFPGTPADWHALYLSGLAGVLVAGLLARHRRVLPAVLAVVAVAVTGYAVHRQAVPVEPRDPVVGCETHAGVRYCPLAGYDSWVPLWREAVEPVATALPPAVIRPPVRQVPGARDVPDAVAVGEVWGRHFTWGRSAREDLAVDYAATVTGLARWSPTGEGTACDGTGQLRTVVALWLTGNPDADLGRTTHGPAERDAAATLLSRPREQVTALLAAHWPRVTSNAPAGDMLTPLGVTGPRPGTGPACP